MVISGGLIFARNPGVPCEHIFCFRGLTVLKHCSVSQKIVQTRMYAQGITLAVLAASVGLTAIHSKDEDLLEAHERSRRPGEAWKQMVG